MAGEIIVAGGGASGLCAAVTAAARGVRVTVLEKAAQPGKKLSMTGNGKCNLSNTNLTPQAYNDAAAALMERLLPSYGTERTLRFFRSIGVLTHCGRQEPAGGLYPVSGQARTVTEALLQELSLHGGALITGMQIRALRRTETGRFEVTAERTADGRREVYSADAVIMATGGLSGPKSTGSTGDGYYILEQVGLRCVPRTPALVRLYSDDHTLPAASGVRADARVRFIAYHDAAADGAVCAEETGEVQLTDRGISGIPVLQASRHVAAALAAGKNVDAVIDLFPGHTAEAFDALCAERLRLRDRRTLTAFLNGFGNSHINEMVLKRCGLSADTPVAGIDRARLLSALAMFRALRVRIAGVGAYEEAQATAGGVALSELTERLEAKRLPGLYCIGELADVDGRCGGYNLQWAWMSGMIAGEAAAS